MKLMVGLIGEKIREKIWFAKCFLLFGWKENKKIKRFLEIKILFSNKI